MLGLEFHKSRREAFAATMEKFSMALIYSGDEKVQTGDQNYTFSCDRNFYYLTGYKKPASYYLIVKSDEACQDVLFIERISERMQMYNGKMQSTEEYKEEFGMTSVFYTDEMLGVIGRYFFHGNYNTLYTAFIPCSMKEATDKGTATVNQLRERYPFLQVQNRYHELAKIRTVKSQEEIAAHRKACDVTALGVDTMLKNMKSGITEGQIEAYFDFQLKTNACGHAFTTIAASGENACTLHYHANDCELKEGDMILFDLGAMSGYYCADVSRTYPINGKFTERQKMLYEVVLKGLEVGLSLSKPGMQKDLIQLESKKVMAEELVKLGVMENVEEISKYYMHGSGHFIGLDTHDVGPDDSILAKDMVFTLEPGLYFKEEGIGIRIEDTILVTEDGCDVLSGHIPKTVADIEAIMSEK